MLKRIIALVLLAGLSNCVTQTKKISTDDKIKSLLSKMTLEEKIGQLNQYASLWDMTGPVPEGKNEQELFEKIKKGLVGSMLNLTGAEATRKAQELAVNNTRLGIPLLFGYDVIHGYRTMFPIPLALAASWDTEAAETTARVAATEAAASGVQWTFAPMVDIARDARWGRIMEGAGEDPYLGSIMAKAQVHGFQGNNLGDDNTIAACAKHFAAYGFAEAGRDYNVADISESTLQNVVLPPFKACVDAGVATFMNSFNEIGGIPSTSNKHLLRDILKGEWDFDGFVVSDWGSISELQNHGVAANKKEAALLAITAGSDMDMEGNCYINHLKDLIKERIVDESLIDDAVRRILKLKFELGLFDDPYRYCNLEKEKVLLCREHLEKSRDIARKSIVLLKNENQLLPLNKGSQKIAVIGDLADDKDSPLGSWRASAISGSAVSLLEGIKNAVEDEQSVHFEQGPVFVTNQPNWTVLPEINESDLTGIEKAVQTAKNADVVVFALGENCYQTGESRSQADIGLKGLQQQLLEAVYAVNHNIVVVLMNGRPLAIDWMAKHVPAIIEVWFLGSEAGNAIANVLFGDYNPSGKLPVSFPRTIGQCPVYYNYKNTGRPWATMADTIYYSRYVDLPGGPLFPFGYGLSYTTFSYENLTVSPESVSMGKEICVNVQVTNTGKREGIETVQLYLNDNFASITRPVKELKRFSKVNLQPGESKIVEFTLNDEDLKFFGLNNKWIIEPGTFTVMVGTNSEELLRKNFTLLK